MSNPAQSWPGPHAPGPHAPGPQAPGPDRSGRAPAKDGEVTTAAFGYLGVIFLGPLIPLAVYAVSARRSPYLHYHAATAVNLSVCCLLYAVCCAMIGGLLALASFMLGLIVGLLLVFALWLTMLRYLISGVGAASRGENNQIPGWLCASLLR